MPIPIYLSKWLQRSISFPYNKTSRILYSNLHYSVRDCHLDHATSVNLSQKCHNWGGWSHTTESKMGAAFLDKFLDMWLHVVSQTWQSLDPHPLQVAYCSLNVKTSNQAGVINSQKKLSMGRPQGICWSLYVEYPYPERGRLPDDPEEASISAISRILDCADRDDHQVPAHLVTDLKGEKKIPRMRCQCNGCIQLPTTGLIWFDSGRLVCLTTLCVCGSDMQTVGGVMMNHNIDQWRIADQ